MKANGAPGVQIRLDGSAPVGCWGESPGGGGLSPLIDVCSELRLHGLQARAGGNGDMTRTWMSGIKVAHRFTGLKIKCLIELNCRKPFKEAEEVHLQMILLFLMRQRHMFS